MKVILKAKSPKNEVLFEAGSMHVTVGRGEQAIIKLKDDNCSRVHCKLYVEENKLWIEDMASKNGTFVNGLSIKKTQLSLGDKILIGDTEILIPSDKNTPQVVKALELKTQKKQRDTKGLEIEDDEALTQVRLNPLSAIKSPGGAQTKKSKRQLAANAMFKDSMAPRIKSEEDDPRLGQKWRFTLASLIDNSMLLVGMAVPPYLFWKFGSKPTAKEDALIGVFELKQVIIVAGASLVIAIITWLVNTKNTGGTVGERLTGIATALRTND